MWVRQPVCRAAASSARIARTSASGGREARNPAYRRPWAGRRRGDHRRVLSVRDEQPAKAGDGGHRRGQLPRVQRRELVHPGRQQETLEAGHPGVVQRPQLSYVARDGATPERHVHRQLTRRGGLLLPQRGHRDRGRDAVQRHVHDRGHPARRGRRGRGGEAFPLGAAGFVHVHVAVHQARQQDIGVRHGDRPARRRLISRLIGRLVVSQAGDPPAADEHGRRALAAGRDHPAGPDRRDLAHSAAPGRCISLAR